MARDQFNDVATIPNEDGLLLALPGVGVEVFQSDGTTLATIYTGPTAPTTSTNPFLTSAAGAIEFWAERGLYKLVITDTETPARFAPKTLWWNSTPAVNGSIDELWVADAAISAGKIAANAISNAKIQDNAITAAEIAADTITAAKIAPDAVGASELADSAVGPGELAGVPRMSLSRDATQNIPNNSLQTVQWNYEHYDTNGMHSNVTNNTRATVPYPGLWTVDAEVQFSQQANGHRQMQVHVNGTFRTYVYQDTFGADEVTSVRISTEIELALNDYVEIKAYQNSGVPLTLNAGFSVTPLFKMSYRGK